MSSLQKLLLATILVAMVIGIFVTWGSIGSVTLTMGLLLALVELGFVVCRRIAKEDVAA